MVILADTLGALIALLFAAFVVLDPVGILSVAIGLTQWLVLHPLDHIYSLVSPSIPHPRSQDMDHLSHPIRPHSTQR